MSERRWLSEIFIKAKWQWRPLNNVGRRWIVSSFRICSLFCSLIAWWADSSTTPSWGSMISAFVNIYTPWKDTNIANISQHPSETVCKSDLILSMFRNQEFLWVRSETFVTGFPGVYYSHKGAVYSWFMSPFPPYQSMNCLKVIDG